MSRLSFETGTFYMLGKCCCVDHNTMEPLHLGFWINEKKRFICFELEDYIDKTGTRHKMLALGYKDISHWSPPLNFCVSLNDHQCLK